MRPEWAVARVRRKGKDESAGLAFAVGRRYLVTCAHVVNSALGRPLREAAPPEESELLLSFRFGDRRGAQPVRSASVAVWLPRDKRSFHLEDVALLELDDGDLPRGVRVLKPAKSTSPGRVQMIGPVPQRANHVHISGELMGAVDHSRFHVDERLHGIFRVAHGFSGGPVWYQDSGRVVGMLQAASMDDEAVDIYVLGLAAIREVYDPFVEGRRSWADRWTWRAAGLFGLAGAAAAVTKVGWHWLALLAGLAVSGIVFAVGVLTKGRLS